MTSINHDIVGPEDTVAVYFPDIGTKGTVLREKSLIFAYTAGRQQDGILFGIASDDSENVTQFDMEQAIKLRDLINVIINENT